MELHFIEPKAESLGNRRGYRNLIDPVCDYLEGHGDRQAYFDRLASLLERPEYYRLVLYLPFDFPNDQPDFKRAYLNAWDELTFIPDRREDFCPRLSGLLDGKSVIKAFHIAPWLLYAGWLDNGDLIDFIAQTVAFAPNPVRAKSVMEAICFCADFGALPNREFQRFKQFEHLARNCNPLTKPKVRKIKPFPLPVHSASLEKHGREFTKPALEILAPCIDRLSLPLPSSVDEYCIIHGTPESYRIFRGNFDHSPICFAEDNGEPINLVHPSNSHLLLNSVWYGYSKWDVENMRTRLTDIVFHLSPEHQKTIALNLERDYIRSAMDTWPATGRFISSLLDAPCAFYDHSFRKLATSLFLKRVAAR